jgi:hypothetical protein
MEEIANPRMKRNNVATTYALAIQSSQETDWPRVNQAIIRRWSQSALTYIKERAWKIVEGRI